MEPRMLIVDDHPLTRDGLAALLEGHGFNIVGEAGGGIEAINKARDLQPDVVLLDLSMPDLDGLSARPKVLASQPVIGRTIALATRYDVSAHVASSIDADRLPAMCGSDTFTTVVSSTSMKVANITAVAISQGLMWRGLPTGHR